VKEMQMPLSQPGRENRPFCVASTHDAVDAKKGRKEKKGKEKGKEKERRK
jgi:hypothetical protein